VSALGGLLPEEENARFMRELFELLRSAGAKLTIRCPKCKWKDGEVVEHAPDCLSLLPPAFLPLLHRLVDSRSHYKEERDRFELALQGTAQSLHLLDRPTHFMLDRWKRLEALAQRVKRLMAAYAEFPKDPACWPIEELDQAYEALDPQSPFVEFHRLWTATVGTTKYNAIDWTQLEARLLFAMRSADRETVNQVLGEAYFLAPEHMH
jgi:hypothetical protein